MVSSEGHQRGCHENGEKGPTAEGQIQRPPLSLLRENVGFSVCFSFYLQSHSGDPRFRFINENDFLHNPQSSKAWEYIDLLGRRGHIKRATEFPSPEDCGEKMGEERMDDRRIRTVKREVTNCETAALGT